METTTDTRKLPREVIEEKRRMAHRLRMRGFTRAEIGQELGGVHPDTIGRWLKLDTTNLTVNRGGRKQGEARRLSADQEKHIRSQIIDKTPDQLKLDYVLWTRKAVCELIEQEFKIQLPVRTVGDYLKRWGMTPQKPAKRAYEQNPKAVQQWLDDDYPKIKAQAKRENAEIYWGDETGMRNDSQHERGYAPKGKTPVVRLNANRTSTNMISAVTNQGKVRFKIFDGSMNTDILIDFCERIIKSAGRKVYLILDNLRVHHAKLFKAWQEKHRADIAVFYLPSYSPELNPDEYLNCDLKAGVHSGKPARNKEKLKKKVRSHMQMLQKKPGRVRKYFIHKKIAYAA
ncbi:IS630 family transposase [Gynuella sunshinyii]|uniref:Transposase n=2 Tax=Gynuella sunshinyii YC6258 TaxID=1445510 RepID=A0A0C5VNU9_9GAMM|nr:IS630 family transposase [Gynuella sunshinyii]AJQ95083.1 transposase [Gynuella sunshinyii YC6258]